MRKKRTLLVLLLAIVSGAVAAFSAIRYLQDRPAPLAAASPSVATQPVVVAAQDLKLGHKITEEDLVTVDWPVAALPAGVASAPSEIVGRSLVSDVYTNEPILPTKLADTGLFGMIPLIPPGMRAISVSVDQVISVAGFVTPETRVDVILLMQPPGDDETVSKVILQNIQALAANQQITEDEEGQPIISTVVTVLVTPEQAEKLALAAHRGRIQMALRNTLDLESIETQGERESRLFTVAGGGGARPRVRTGATGRAAPESSIIEMYQGGVRTLISYE